MSKGIYVAGPMRGYPQFNFPAFFEAEAKFKADGWTVYNPARKDTEQHGPEMFAQNATGNTEAASSQGFSLRDALKWDTEKICLECDAIAMLPGWEKSQGAFAEWALAKALGLEIKYL